MAELERIFTGMDAGPEAIQKNFEALNAEGNLVNYGSQGIVALNGSDLTGTNYSVAHFDGWSIVSLFYHLTNKYTVDVLQLPESIKPYEIQSDIQTVGTDGKNPDKLIYATLESDGKLHLSTSSMTLWEGFTYFGTITYITLH